MLTLKDKLLFNLKDGDHDFTSYFINVNDYFFVLLLLLLLRVSLLLYTAVTTIIIIDNIIVIQRSNIGKTDRDTKLRPNNQIRIISFVYFRQLKSCENRHAYQLFESFRTWTFPLRCCRICHVAISFLYYLQTFKSDIIYT